MRAIIGLVGQLAAGKGTAAKYLVEHHGATSMRFSDPLRETLAIYDLPNTRDNMQDLSAVLRQRFGDNVLDRAITRKAREMAGKLVVIDGIRRFNDIEAMAELPQFCLVAIAADQRLRYDRCVSRGENEGDAAMSFEDFCAKDTAEAEAQIPEVMSKAKFTIDNSGTVEDLYRRIDEIVQQISTP